MAGRRRSGRHPSMSRAAKQLLKEKKRREKLGIREKEPEVSTKGLWILVIAALIALGFIIARIAFL